MEDQSIRDQLSVDEFVSGDSEVVAGEKLDNLCVSIRSRE